MSDRSKRIFEAIENSGLSYGELSKITDIPKSALQRYATGETEKVPLDRLTKIANATGVSPVHLMGWDSQKRTADQLSVLLHNDYMQQLFDVAKDLKEEQFKRLLSYASFLKENEDD